MDKDEQKSIGCAVMFVGMVVIVLVLAVVGTVSCERATVDREPAKHHAHIIDGRVRLHSHFNTREPHGHPDDGYPSVSYPIKSVEWTPREALNGLTK